MAFALLGLAPAAGAVPRSCRVVTDAAGDENVWGLTGDGDLDVVSADIATNATYLTAVVRTATLRDVDTDSPTGRAYYVELWIGGTGFGVFGATSPDGTGGYVAKVTGRPGGTSTTSRMIGLPNVRLDVARREVRMTVPLAVFTPVLRITKGMVLSNVMVSSSRYAGPASDRHTTPDGSAALAGGIALEIDATAHNGRYVAGTPSCVTPGP
jgi:hypothetical protein